MSLTRRVAKRTTLRMKICTIGPAAPAIYLAGWPEPEHYCHFVVYHLPCSTCIPHCSPRSLPDALARVEVLEVAAADNRALEATERRDAVVGHLKEGLLLLDDQVRVTIVNDEYCYQLGMPLPAAQ